MIAKQRRHLCMPPCLSRHLLLLFTIMIGGKWPLCVNVCVCGRVRAVVCDVPTCDCSCKWNIASKPLLWNLSLWGVLQFLSLLHLLPCSKFPRMHTFCTLPHSIRFLISMYVFQFMIAVPNIHLMLLLVMLLPRWVLVIPVISSIRVAHLQRAWGRKCPPPVLYKSLSVIHLQLEPLDYLYKRWLLFHQYITKKSVTCQILLSWYNIRKSPYYAS